PVQARWLSPVDKETLLARLARENVAEHRDLKRALQDSRVIALGFVTFGILFGIYGTGLWLPQIVGDMGFSPLATGFVVAVPYSATIGVMVWWSASSDRRQERIRHTGYPLLIAAAAYAVAAIARNDAVSLI